VTLLRLVMVRHGQTDFNVEGRMQGHLDSELTATGVDQAHRAAQLLVGYRPDRLISSDLSRAARTAEQIGFATGLAVSLDERLRETNLGKWEGFTSAQVEVDWPGALALWRSDPTWAPPGGESRVDVANRALPVVEELDREFDGDDPVTAMFCAHGGLICSLTCALLGLAPPSWVALAGLGNAHWAIVQRRAEPDSSWRLVGFDVGPIDSLTDIAPLD
jgi:2,3-bisphosphoglycerate-dependent phosphoglycerate mutase/probable phosphoglycerate mutase